ncbi:TPA: hypothetical protein DCE37_24290 [Candidatus Latescibacteria bacterium]|nr:hypothetical protein [Candidatus Latescibacterota bacterium]
MVALCEGQRVDLCAFTGDYWFGQADEPRGSLRNLARIVDACDARIGIFGVLGNHDAPEDAGLIEQLGIRILMNEATDIVAHGTHLHIVGVDDPSTQQDDLAGSCRVERPGQQLLCPARPLTRDPSTSRPGWGRLPHTPP